LFCFSTSQNSLFEFCTANNVLGPEIIQSFEEIRVHLKPDGTRAETGIRLSPKQMSPFKSVGVSVQSTTGS
jgi:hypothetical protein